MAFSGGSLAHTYSSPAIARLLVGTGRLTATAPRRLTDQEQSRLYRYWWYAGHLPGLDEQFFLAVAALTGNTAFQDHVVDV